MKPAASRWEPKQARPASALLLWAFGFLMAFVFLRGTAYFNLAETVLTAGFLLHLGWLLFRGVRSKGRSSDDGP